MGRGDGSGRLVSPEGADDSGTGILHVDMDAFYAAVEVLHDPSLRGLPLIIGGREGRSVVSSASYEARRYGVRSAMPVGQALRLCPTARVVPPDFERYRAVSAQVMAIFESITPLVEPLSIDEAFLDVRGARRLWGSPGRIAVLIRRRVQDEVGITCSVGVAATKHVAKMASTISKPDGMLIVPAARTQEFLDPRPVGAMWGVGPKAADALARRGIRLISDVRTSPPEALDRALGPALGARIRALATGQDARTVETERIEKSIGHEETFDRDVEDHELLRSELRRLADRVGARLRASGWHAGGVAIKIRFADFTTVNRSVSLAEATDVGQRLGETALSLFEQIDRRDPVRLVGVRAERLRPAAAGALALWDDDEDQRRLEGTLDDARARFGVGMITRARHMSRGESRSPGHPPVD
ncbi:DNA polymerase IV [Microbacterium esteraromaticum]|uniref:DNA polymerase IV n=1 Tax=Microbacterium esteraromaticum TaxID=57043 RepID=A0A939DW24_9MICO|nr:DNA polymerase IV [Microbacterium esteraromaticum]MBN8206054.1 DNA polymerase IV [Microbacterium esteraromaticum]MBN8416209.1 DNA polymerase IV [Microbacterium esteraromaticum]MBN8423434.1 DNA polymerase IV [Microbacterium esteraromaticum]